MNFSQAFGKNSSLLGNKCSELNLGDPELELIDPTPNVHTMFLHFDKTFFWAKLANRTVVRWSKRMYSCAGVCSYEGRGGLCDIALSEPLLKLRPRKDLVETLLHEMIHAYLFITLRFQDRDGHGPNFQEHMYRINKAAGINITIYHSFHDEVELYQTHWWRCNGPCQLRKPHFGIVRRSSNTAPGPRDYWWTDHQRKCGGMFIKIKEPEKNNKKTKTVVAQPKGDITKYVTSTKKTGDPKIVQVSDIKSDFSKVQIKSNNSNTVVVSQKGVPHTINTPATKPPSFLTGKGYTIAGTRVRSNSADVTETVRNIWAKKQLTPNLVSPIGKKPNVNVSPKTTATNINKNVIPKAIKHKTNTEHEDSPPGKVKRIDDYFRKNATTLLKDIYGSNIEVAESSNNNKLIAVNNSSSSSHVAKVDCPICKLKIEENKINGHLDECLNRDLISTICSGNEIISDRKEQNPVVANKVSKQVSRDIRDTLSSIPPYKPKVQVKQEGPSGNRDDNKTKEDLHKSLTSFKGIVRNETEHGNLLKTYEIQKLDPVDVNKGKPGVKDQFHNDQRKAHNFVAPEENKDLGSGSPSPKEEEVRIPSALTLIFASNCPCCGHKITMPMSEHLEDCLAFFDKEMHPEEQAANIANGTIIIDDDNDDIFDETQVLNATGTKFPCPCCMQMVENDEMNAHLDHCLR